MKLKLLLYRFFSGRGKWLQKLLSSFVTVRNLGFSKQKKHPFLVVITVDTESGYVAKNERRVWQKEKPNAFIGYHGGIKNLRSLFHENNIKGTFFLSTQCFSSTGKERKKILNELKELIREEHEIGMHLHPDSDLALQKRLSEKFNATSAFFYNYEEKLSILKAAKDLIKKNLCANLVSFRWGNWALDSDGARALNEIGFKIDSSATPGIKGHINDTMKYDWSRVKRHYPWVLSVEDYQNTDHNNSKIVEIPIATSDFLGLKLRADPVNSVLLDKAFLEYYKRADRSKKPFPFVVITHSSEATYSDGKETIALRDLRAFISLAKKFKDVEFVTLKEAYRRIRKERR